MQTSKNTILITGGATGIGLGLAEQFLKQDNTVIICGRRENRLKEAKEKLPALHTRVCDITKIADRINLVSWVLESFPKLNIVINNAGIQHNFNLNSPVDISAVEKECDTNFIAAIKDDVFEAAIGFAANLRLKREELFHQLNPEKQGS